MRRRSSGVVVVTLALLGAVTAACGGDSGSEPGGGTKPTPGGVPFSFTVDATIKPRAASISGGDDGLRPLTAFVDAEGVATDFVENELVVQSPTDAELAGLVARYGATVGTDTAATPQPDAIPRLVVLRLAHPLDATDSFAADAPAIGAFGHYVFGSAQGARLVATAAHEAAAGLKIAPNFVAHGDDHTFLRRTEEGGGVSAFSMMQNQAGHTGNIVAAWQTMAWAGGFAPRSVPLAVIDGGFYVDGQGHPVDAGTGTDLPFDVQQRTFRAFSTSLPTVGAPNRATCTNGSPCPWHGNRTAGVATGLLDNKKGWAGTGGQVAVPILLDSGLDDFTVVQAVGAAAAAGARVINLSFGGACNGACRFGRDLDGFTQTFASAIGHGRVIVAAAGNDNQDVNAVHTWPCRLDGVICVGAIDAKGHGYGYSNYGTGISVFAPTDIPVMPDPMSATPTHGGTSAATPFVSGVVAMMLAQKGSLSPAEVKSILESTATPAPSTPKVNASAGELDARAALLAVVPLAADRFEPNETYDHAVTLTSGEQKDLTLATKGDHDYFRFTATDFGTVRLEIENAWEGFGYLVPVPQAESGTLGGGGSASQSLSSTGARYSANVTPGTYRFVVTGNAQPYNVKLTVSETGLSPDAYESNDTPATATAMGSALGWRTANIHAVTDVDHYAFVAPQIAADETLFWSVAWAEMPITLDLLDGGGAVIDSRSGNEPYFAFNAAQSGSSFTVRVSGPRGRYGIDHAIFKKPSNVPPQIVAQIPWLDSSDPAPWNGIVDKVDLWIGFTAAPSAIGLPPAKGISFTSSSSLHAELVDSTGKPVSPTVALPGGSGETIDLAPTTVGSNYFLHVTRAAATLGSGGGSLPALPFSASFAR